MLPTSPPNRKVISHEIPEWAARHSVYFISISCKKRGSNFLAHDRTSSDLIQSWLYLQTAGKCTPLFIMIMKNHLHLLSRFQDHEGKTMAAVISSWKRFTARTLAVEWQRNFFDHRIRNQNDFNQKWEYIQNNPVKAGYVKESSDWPHQWVHECPEYIA